MTKPLTKEALIRSDWIVRLRSEGERQCDQYYFRAGEIGLRVCALGLLIETADIPMLDSHEPEDVGALAGLSFAQSHDITNRNDGGGDYHPHTFAEIADVVEGWFQKV
jgi:hypothetical protein